MIASLDSYSFTVSPPPSETKEGWLCIYHGVRHTPSGAMVAHSRTGA